MKISESMSKLGRIGGIQSAKIRFKNKSKKEISDKMRQVGAGQFKGLTKKQISEKMSKLRLSKSKKQYGKRYIR
jgi:hypothetical protein